jgi:hypothetical protein
MRINHQSTIEFTIDNDNRQSFNRQSVNLHSAIGNRQSHIGRLMDPDYKKMMTWVLIVLVGSVLAAIAIVEWVVRYFGEGG